MSCLKKITIWFTTMVFICIGQTTNLDAADQVALFNGFTTGSWKSQNVNIFSQNVSIEEHLVRIFNTAVWGPVVGNVAQINPLIADLDTVSGHYRNVANPADWVTLVTAQISRGVNILANNHSPRKWMRELNLREIYRFKELAIANPDLINNNNYATDDLVKARSLSGIFWQVDTTNTRYAAPIFSGMLVPGQNITNHSYQVYTCLHGFSSGNANNNIAYYFVPYGVEVSNDPSSGNYVPMRGFRVTHVRHFRVDIAGTNLDINNAFFNNGSAEMNPQNLYSNKDFAMATIEGQTTIGTIALRDILAGRPGLPFIIATTAALPNLDNANGLAAIGSGTLGPNERLFVIGLASHSTSGLDHRTAVATSLTNEIPTNEPKRSFSDDQNVKIPANIGYESSASLPSFPGLSGGAVLRCQLDPHNIGTKRCKIVGTNWGAERVFNDNNEMTGFKSVINRIHQ